MKRKEMNGRDTHPSKDTPTTILPKGNKPYLNSLILDKMDERLESLRRAAERMGVK